ncbi:hypothetical protein ACMBCN_01160, partial [Candidatus Liberibacter asiaticus]|nr:hypothetical protein [Candidatus Liberibacter asiaticus]
FTMAEGSKKGRAGLVLRLLSVASAVPLNTQNETSYPNNRCLSLSYNYCNKKKISSSFGAIFFYNIFYFYFYFYF